MVYAHITNTFGAVVLHFVLLRHTLIFIQPPQNLHGPFSSICSHALSQAHVPVIGFLFSRLFPPNSVTKSLRLYLAASVVLELRLGCPVLPHQALSLTRHLQRLPQLPGVSQEHPLQLRSLWKPENWARAAAAVIYPSRRRPRFVAHRRSSLFWAQHGSVPPLPPLSRSQHRATGCRPHSALRGTWVKVLVFSGDRAGDSRLLRDNLPCFCFSSRIGGGVKGLLVQLVTGPYN